MEQLPAYVYVLFILTTLATVILLWRASHFSLKVLLLVCIWLIAQFFIAASGFYLRTDVMPPRFLLTVVPPLLFIILLFTTQKGRAFIDSLDLRLLTIIHVIRIPVEIVLLWLSIYKTVPGLMSYEGKNFDILSGITAPIIYVLMFKFKLLNRNALLVWNFICLGLLFNIIALAVLSAPLPFQRLAFDQPNIAVMYEPFVWLPCCIVPVVLFSHLASIRQIILKTGNIMKENREAISLSPENS